MAGSGKNGKKHSGRHGDEDGEHGKNGGKGKKGSDDDTAGEEDEDAGWRIRVPNRVPIFFRSGFFGDVLFDMMIFTIFIVTLNDFKSI